MPGSEGRASAHPHFTAHASHLIGRAEARPSERIKVAGNSAFRTRDNRRFKREAAARAPCLTPLANLIVRLESLPADNRLPLNQVNPF